MGDVPAWSRARRAPWGATAPCHSLRSSPQRGQTPPWRPSGVLKRKLSTEVGKCDIMAPDLWAAHASPAPWGGSTPRRRPPAPAAASFDAPAAFAAPMPAAGTRTPAGEQLRPRVPARGAGLGPASPAPAPAPAARPTSAPAARPAVAGAQWDAPRPSAERPFGPRATPRVHPTVDIPPRPSTAGGGPSPAATPAWATSLWRSLASPLSRTAGVSLSQRLPGTSERDVLFGTSTRDRALSYPAAPRHVQRAELPSVVGLRDAAVLPEWPGAALWGGPAVSDLRSGAVAHRYPAWSDLYRRCKQTRLCYCMRSHRGALLQSSMSSPS